VDARLVGNVRLIVDAINRMGHMMDLRTVAEFVESPAIVEELRSIGVDFA
jgi:ammonium transporter, Amt family